MWSTFLALGSAAAGAFRLAQKILLYKDERKIAFVLRRCGALIKYVLGGARTSGAGLEDGSARELFPSASFNVRMQPRAPSPLACGLRAPRSCNVHFLVCEHGITALTLSQLKRTCGNSCSAKMRHCFNVQLKRNW